MQKYAMILRKSFYKTSVRQTFTFTIMAMLRQIRTGMRRGEANGS